MKARPIVNATAAVTALVLCAATGTAAAATTTTTVPAAGTAASSIAVLSVRAAGHTFGLGGLTLSSDTLTGSPVAKVVVTPVIADGTPYGEQTITPASSPKSVPSQTTPGALAALATLTSPGFVASATSGPSSKVGATSFGSAQVLGLDVPLDGTLDLSSAVSATTGALGQKTVELKNLSLPSIAALLNALGLDLNALPVGTLTTLLSQLDLVTGAVTSAESAVTAATATVTTDQGLLTTAQSTLTSATNTLDGALALIPGAPTDLSGYLALTGAAKTLFDTANPTIAGLADAVVAAQAAVTSAQAVLDAAVALLNSAIAALKGAVVAVLGGTPLLSLGSLSVTSKALVTSAQPGGQVAQVLSGKVTGLKVLGTDVLQTALGSSTVDVTALLGSAGATVADTVNGLTGTLSSVLSAVPGLTIPAPTVSLLKKTTSTGVENGFGKALDSVAGLSITVPGITLPSALALPGAATLPGMSTSGSNLLSAPLGLDLLTLSDQAAFRPAVTTSTTTGGTPGAGTPPTELPHTGLPAGLAVVALASLGGALYLRRRTAQTA